MLCNPDALGFYRHCHRCLLKYESAQQGKGFFYVLRAALMLCHLGRLG